MNGTTIVTVSSARCWQPDEGRNTVGEPSYTNAEVEAVVQFGTVLIHGLIPPPVRFKGGGLGDAVAFI